MVRSVMGGFEQDDRAGYAYLLGTVVDNICALYDTTPDQLKADPMAAHELLPESLLDLMGVLMSMQGFLLEEDADRSAYLIHRVIQQIGPVVYEALGVSPALTAPGSEVLN